jgi:multimeric flavodoxin WrbA
VHTGEVIQEDMMKVLILNGSPRGPKSVTGRLLAGLSKGLSDGGASVHEIQVSSLKIAPCTACLSCMHRKPGECAIKDDMEGVYSLLKSSDLLILGTPVYVDGMSAQLKAVLDRSISCLQPFLARDGNHRIRHPFTWRMPGRFILVSTSGFPEVETFGPLIATFRAQAANFGSTPIGEVCIPGSIALQMEPARLDERLPLLEEIGRILAATGEISHNLLQQINQPLLTVDEYLVVAEQYESWCREQLGKYNPWSGASQSV